MGLLSVVRRPSSVRVAIISEPNARISFKFWLLLPLDHTLTLFYFFKKPFRIFYNFLSFSLTWDPMEAKISKRYSCYKSQRKAFKHFLNFLPNGPFSFSSTWDPMGAKISKCYSSYKSQPKVFKLFLIFFPIFLTKLRLEFLKF